MIDVQDKGMTSNTFKKFVCKNCGKELEKLEYKSPKYQWVHKESGWYTCDIDIPRAEPVEE